MGGSLVCLACTPLCSSKTEMTCFLPSSRTWKSFLSRPVTGSSLPLVTTTSTRTTFTFDWKGKTVLAESGTEVWAAIVVIPNARVKKRKQQRHKRINSRFDSEGYHSYSLR